MLKKTLALFWRPQLTVLLIFLIPLFIYQKNWLSVFFSLIVLALIFIACYKAAKNTRLTAE